MHIPQLQELSDTSSIYSYVRQNAFAERVATLGAYSFEGDLIGQQLSFVGQRGRIDLGCQLIATLAPGPRSLMWAWANPSSGPRQTDVSESLRAYGQAHGIRVLTEAEIPFEGVAGLSDGEMDDWVKAAAHEVGRAYTTITGRSPYVALDPAGHGQQAVLAVWGLDDLPEPRIDVTTPRILAEGIQQTGVQDHRRAIHCFATKSGWRVQWSPDLSSLIVEDPVNGNSASVGFDHLGRNHYVNMTLQPGSMG